MTALQIDSPTVKLAGQRTVFVVDHDDRTSKEVKAAVNNVEVKHFPSGGEFLRFYDRNSVGCMIVNIVLPDMSGLELQDRLLAQYCTLPMIFVGTGSDVAQAVRVMRRGAIDFLDRPFQKQDLSTALAAALELLDQRQTEHAELAGLGSRFEQLTPREREVLDAVVSGKSNRATGDDLGISEKTVETHRLRLMNKMQVNSLAELVRAALRLREFREGQSLPAVPRQSALHPSI